MLAEVSPISSLILLEIFLIVLFFISLPFSLSLSLSLSLLGSSSKLLAVPKVEPRFPESRALFFSCTNSS